MPELTEFSNADQYCRPAELLFERRLQLGLYKPFLYKIGLFQPNAIKMSTSSIVDIST